MRVKFTVELSNNNIKLSELGYLLRIFFNSAAQNAAAADKKCSAAENCTSCLLQDSECTWCYKMVM